MLSGDHHMPPNNNAVQLRTVEKPVSTFDAILHAFCAVLRFLFRFAVVVALLLFTVL